LLSDGRSSVFNPEHGGALNAAAEYFDIPREQWLDLSTGINPDGWPVPEIPAHVWQRLPEENDQLRAAAADYYTSPYLTPVAGSQQGIQFLPMLYQGQNKKKNPAVWVTAGSYSEHGKAWAEQGYRVRRVACDHINQLLRQQPVDVLILVNPDNPSGHRWPKEQLLHWWEMLQSRGGWLIVDEAFMDCTPEHSLCSDMPKKGLFVLRSLGKFFGLAGVRSGFLFAAADQCRRIEKLQGPWALNYPAQYLSELALADEDWIKAQRQSLAQASLRLAGLLEEKLNQRCEGTDLFQTLYFPRAEKLFFHLAKAGILTRYLKPTSQSAAGIRFGLPGTNEDHWSRLADSLTTFNQEN